jgi:small subunit ribosomal protein S6
MHAYEVAVVVRADLSDQDRSVQIETFKGWISTQGGNVTQIDHWGRRRLAYPVSKQRDGYYLLMKAEMPATALAEIERSLRLSENVLRFLITREND